MADPNPWLDEEAVQIVEAARRRLWLAIVLVCLVAIAAMVLQALQLPLA